MRAFITTLVLCAGFSTAAFCGDKFQKFPYFETANPKLYKTVGETIALKNMPRVRSQSSVGLCSAFAVATMIDFANCHAAADTQKACSDLSDDEMASPVDLTRYAYYDDVEDNNVRAAYTRGLKEGAFSTLILAGALATGRIAKESCAPFTQFTNGIDDADNRPEGIWDRYKELYEQTKTINKDDPDQCLLEASKIKDKYNLSGTPKDISKSFGQESYGLFLDKLLVPFSCSSKRKEVLELHGKWAVEYYPDKRPAYDPADTETSKLDQTVRKIKWVLTELGRPVLVDFCMTTPFDPATKCTDGHTVVIKGFRSVCKINDQKDCRPMFQVQNSWGQVWQDENDDGWIFADIIIERTYYESYSFAWIVDKKEDAGEKYSWQR